MLLELQQYPQAVQDLTKAIELDSDAVKAYVNRGLAYRKMLDQKSACLDWNQAYRLGDCEYYHWAKNHGEC